MKLLLGMPEVLVAFSAVMYSQSWGLSIFALVLGLLSRFIAFSIESNKEKESEKNKEDMVQSIVDDVATIVGAFSDKD